MPQAIVTLNLLRPSRINPTLSAHAQLHGLLDFNATLFAPPGKKIIVHQSQQSDKVGHHEVNMDVTYIGPRTITADTIYTCQKTGAVIQPETVEFSPHNSNMPFRSLAENETIAAIELIHALRNPAPAAPYAHIGDDQMQALEQLAEFFNAPRYNHNNRFPQRHRNSYLSHHQGWLDRFQG